MVFVCSEMLVRLAILVASHLSLVPAATTKVGAAVIARARRRVANFKHSTRMLGIPTSTAVAHLFCRMTQKVLHTGPAGGIRRIQTLFLILSKHKIFRYFMHMRAKTICGFALILKSLCDITIFDGSYPTFDP